MAEPEAGTFRPAPLEVAIAGLEKLHARGEHRRIEEELVRLLATLSGPRGDMPDRTDEAGEAADEPRVSAACTRLAALIAGVLLRAEPPLAEETLLGLALHNRTVGNVFALSGFQSTDHLLEALSDPVPRGDGTVEFRFPSPAHGARFIAAYALECRAVLPPAGLLQAEPRVGFPVYLAQYGRLNRLEPRVFERIVEELEQPSIEGTLADALPLPDHALPLLSHLWFACSYVDTPARHRIKGSLNRLMRAWIARRGLPDRVPPLPSRPPSPTPGTGQGGGRPRLLVAAEHLRATHVMHRCYWPMIERLEEAFEVVVLADPEHMDAAAARLVRRLLEVPSRPLDPERLVDLVSELRPDVIYFPSLGMHVWTLVLANMRLAPLQVMTTGHPATSASPEIDCVLLPPPLLGEGERFTERAVLFRRGTFLPPTGDRAHVERLASARRSRLGRELEGGRVPSRPIRLAVPSSLQKLNPPFLETLERIRAAGGRPTELHFFPNVSGLEYLLARRALQRRFPESRVHRPRRVDAYLARLAECDLVLGAFPFGGATSAQDALALGIPLVSRLGPEPHERTEWQLIERVGLPGWLVGDTRESYEQAAMRLIRDDALRLRLAQHLEQAPRRLYEAPPGTDPDRDFTDALAWLHRHRERVLRSPRRVWDLEARARDVP